MSEWSFSALVGLVFGLIMFVLSLIGCSLAGIPLELSHEDFRLRTLFQALLAPTALPKCGDHPVPVWREKTRPPASSSPRPAHVPVRRFVGDAAIKAPPVCDYGSKVKNWLMLLNDQLGDCTVAGLLHAIMLWLSQNGLVFQPTNDDAKGLYTKLCGYVDGDPSTDNGGVEIDILKAWKKIAHHGL